MRSLSLVVVASLALASSAFGAAGAQTTSTDPRVACRSSAYTVCAAEVKARDRPAVRACLIKNFDKATPECQAAMKAAQAANTAGQTASPPKP